MDKRKQIFIIGDSAFAEVAYEYFTHDSEYRVLGFAVERAYLKKDRLFALPVVAFEDVEQHFPVANTAFFAALVYTQLNRLRTRLYEAAKSKGYRAASYVSSRAFVWPNVVLGEHVFIFEDNTVQPFVRIGNNVVLWSGNHIGHHSRIDDNCFISSHVVVSGFCEIGRNSFLGVNATIANNVALAEDTWLGPGVTITSNTEANQLFGSTQAQPAKVSARRFFKVREG